MQTFDDTFAIYADPVTRRLPLSSRFWLSHAVLPALAMLVLLVAFQRVAHRYLPGSISGPTMPSLGRWMGRGRWWADDLLHTDGRDAILLVIAGLLVTIGGSAFSPRLQAARGTAVYLLATIALAWGLVGLLKHVTNVPCPWSLQGFGGERPHVALFAPRPAGFGAAACFPGAHSASGFALFAFYFAFRDQRLTSRADPACWSRWRSARHSLSLRKRAGPTSSRTTSAARFSPGSLRWGRIWSGAAPLRSGRSACGVRSSRRCSNVCR